MARGRKTGGRKLGTPNKATTEQRLLAERAAADADAARHPLAKEVLSDLMNIFAEFAERSRQEGNLDRFEAYAIRAIDCAKALAPFESPRYGTVTVGTSVVSKIEIVGGLDLPALNAGKPAIDGEVVEPLPPGSIITVDEIEASAE
jgi:hypothetical protein